MENGARARPAIAALLGFLAAGLGQLYAGRPARAFACFGLVELATLLTVLSILGFQSLLGVWLPIAFGLLLMLAIFVDAYRVARLPRPRLRQRSRRIWACLGFFVFATVAGGAFGEAVRALLAEPYRVPSASMLPTLLIGDHAYADRFTYRHSEPKLADLAIHRVAEQGSSTVAADRRPELQTTAYVKRLVGLPGDTIEVRDSVLYRNGERLTHTPDSVGRAGEDPMLLIREEQLGDRVHRIADDPARRPPDFGPSVVPPDRYFLMGDNRDHSLDSRHYGTVHRDDMLGPLTFIYWSWDFNGSWGELARPSRLIELLRSHTRWGRNGQRLR